MAGHFGGEEFLVLMPDSTLEDTKGIATRMRLALERAAIPHCAPNAHSVVTASFGVSSTAISANTALADLLSAADEALYLAKAGGRNQVASQLADKPTCSQIASIEPKAHSG